ncbi:MAG TPA: cytochrome b/b6 domain-containing protein [Microlunatus sp.]|nr:cytochrome b/b6 domain-containing protein [Microlunatus sp.]
MTLAGRLAAVTLSSLRRVRWRNGERGYGAVTKLLHWLTVLALLGQVTIGLSMEASSAAERAEASAEAREDAAGDAADAAEDAAPTEREEDAAEAAGERAEERADAAADRASDTEYLVGPADGVDLLDLHVLLGTTILVLGVVRVVWRRVGGLPPWAAELSAPERVVAGWTEKALLGCLFLVPGTGLLLVLSQDDALVVLHVAAQLVLALAVVVHLTLILRHSLFGGRLLQRMLPGR